MTEQRRVQPGLPPRPKAAGSTVLTEMRKNDAPLSEYVRAGGFRGFTPEELFK